MSLQNPVVSRSERRQRAARVTLPVAAVVLIVAAAVAGWSFGEVALHGTDGSRGLWVLAGMIPSMVALVLGGFLLLLGLLWWRPGVLAVSVALVVAGLGVVRTGVDQVGGIIGLVVAALGPLLLVVAALVRSRASARRREVAAVRATGTETVATVADVPDGPDPTSSGLIGLVTFTFTDGAQRQRWVQRRVLIRREGDVRVGDTTRLWYDAAAPDDERRISVEMEMGPGSLGEV
ncbi:MAG TPA: DUF3592 domain-containing protein [Nocardioides sp.]